MLQGDIQIFRITDKKFYPNYIEYSLHKPIQYLQTRENRILVANQPPFDRYQVGEYLGIDTDTFYWGVNSAEQKVISDRNVVGKVIARPPQFYLKKNFSSDEFGDGWVEEGE